MKWTDFLTKMPHCDAKILHRPTVCRYCDLHPEWQALRIAWGINFTGEHDSDKVICPSEQTRPIEHIEAWEGNVAQ